LSLAFTLQSVEIGVDARGKVTSAPVVIPLADGPASVTPRSLKPAAQKVMAAFARLVDEGKTFPVLNVQGVPPGRLVVRLADLHDTTFTLNTYPHPKPDGTDRDAHTRWRNGRNAAWKRGHEEVFHAGLLRCEGDFVWDPKAVTGAVIDGDERR